MSIFKEDKSGDIETMSDYFSGNLVVEKVAVGWREKGGGKGHEFEPSR